MIGTCVYCLIENVEIHKDHLIPRVRGGSDEIENCVTACEKCNLSKATMTPSEWRTIGLASWIYEKERFLSVKYRMKARNKNHPSLYCMWCESLLTERIISCIRNDKINHSAMIYWWEPFDRLKPNEKDVFKFGLACFERRCMDKCDGVPGSLRSVHVEHVVGQRALREMGRVLYHYKWLWQIQRQAIETYDDLSRLPDVRSGGRIERAAIHMCG
jgi:hypothetical protein